MSVLTRYISWIFLRSVIATTSAILAFALLFDLLDVSDDLLSSDIGAVAALTRYIILRIPSLFSEILPIATLLAGLFAASALLRSSEMVVIWASGVSLFTLMFRLAPAACLLLVVKFATDDWLVPRSIEGLRQWGIGNFAQDRLGTAGDFLWFRQDSRIYRMQLTDAKTMTVFELDDQANLQARLDAGSVEFAEGTWHLNDVTRQASGIKQDIESLSIQQPLSPETLALLYKPPQELSFLQLATIVYHQGYDAVPAERHRSWLYQRMAGTFAPVLMGLLAFALARRFDRRQGAGLLFLKGVAIGFGYIIINGMGLALSESGLAAPAYGSFLPLFILFLIVTWTPLSQHLQGSSMRGGQQ